MTSARFGFALLLLLALTLLPLSAFANCSLSGGNEQVNVTITSPITIDPSAAVGTVLATSPVTNPNPNTSQISCNTTTTSGVINLVGGQPGSGTTYDTGVPGVGYRILHPDTTRYLAPYGSDSIGSGTFTLSVASAIQLVKTGPITVGSTLSAGTLGYWQFAGHNSTVRAEDFVLANAVKFVAPSCSVTTPSIAVALPTVSNSALSATGATAGTTAFNIGLSCSGAASGQTLAIQFDTATTPPGTTGVISPGGTAANVGVQLVDSNYNAVTFGTPVVAGTTPTGAYNLTYYARYYATATPVSAGTVSATATFTISYP